MSDGFYSGKRAIVTGAASGIGRSMAMALAAGGCRVLVADIDADGADATAKAIGGDAKSGQCDVSDRSHVVALAAAADQAMGGVDVVFANAGVSLSGPIIDADPAAFDWLMGVNIRGAWNTASVFARRWTDAGQAGAICFTASEHALGMQHPGMGLYTASKNAVLGLAEILRVELAPSITVSALCPGMTATDLHLAKRNSTLPPDPPRVLEFASAVMARGMSPDEVADAALRGVAKGEFFIVTHPTSRRAADERASAVADAFDRQAPWSDAASAYDPNVVMAQVRDEYRQRTRGEAPSSGSTPT